MTSLATIIGMVPMALKFGTGSEQYAPLARAIIGGLTASVVLTIFIVPAAYLLVYRQPGESDAFMIWTVAVCAALNGGRKSDRS